MITERNTIIKIKSDNLSGSGTLSVTAERVISKIKFSTIEKTTGKEEVFSFLCDKNAFSGEFRISKPRIWSVENPELYGFKISIKYADKDVESERAEGAFAFRKIKSENDGFYLNGKRIFIRGYIRGATAHEHSDNCKLGEKEFYRKNIRAAKKFGFNLVRFHSYIPSDKFFEVADEEGMLVHYEFRVPESKYNNLEEMLVTNTKFAGKDKIGRLIDLFYNHPSLVEYCIGNEIKEGREEVEKLGEFIKKTDPSRLYIDTCAWGLNNRKIVDLDVQHMGYFFPYGKHADMFDSFDNMLVCPSYDSDEVVKTCDNSVISRTPVFNVPLVAHEVCHYTALRDYEGLRAKFKKYGVSEPWWIEEELKIIEEKGFKENYGTTYNASKYFQKECWKTAFEALRFSEILSGFHFLQLADTDVYENSNGIIDCFDDENYVTSEEFLRFNGNAVLLSDIKNRNIVGGRTLEVRIKLSDYRTSGETKGDFVYSLTSDDGEIFASGEMRDINIERRGNYEICKLSLCLPSVKIPKACLLGVSLSANNACVAENSWRIWVYPEEKSVGYDDFISYDKDGVTITDDIEKAFSSLGQGKKVCLVYRSDWTRHLLDKNMSKPKYAFKATWNRFKPVIWDRGNNYGGLCDEKTLNKFGFPTGKFYDFNYGEISEDCDKIILDDFPIEVNSLVTGIDKSTRDRFDAYKSSFNLPEIMPDRCWRKFSYLFELKVGEGSLLACGFNLTGLSENDPSSVAMGNFIKNYIASDDFAPKNEISLGELKTYMEKCSGKPVKERMMTQYWELDDAPVESKKYWEESRKYLERED